MSTPENNPPNPVNPVKVPKQTIWHKRFGPVGGSVAVFVLEVLQIVIVSAAIVLPIRYFLVQPFNVKGESMEPTFNNNDYLVIDELTYRFRNPERGEVIVFRYPVDPSQFFIKRVIGLPGETVQVSDGHITIYNASEPNGFVLDEPYLSSSVVTTGNEKVTLGADEYMVFGDNRTESLDSRVFGPIKKTAIVGRVWIRGLPFSAATIFDKLPTYNS